MRTIQFFTVAFISLIISLTSASQGADSLPEMGNKLPLTTSIELTKGSNESFLEHVGPADDPHGTTLAMNTPYAPILSLRGQIAEQLGLAKPLNFFTGWKKEGEAHVTTVTPVEYDKKIQPFVTPERINAIALQYDIQSSDLEILGIGRGQADLNGQMEDTYFVIVRSENLLRIRQALYEEYLREGGPKDGWNPNDFYPHITIGYTGIRDLHISDDVIKDVAHSLDPRFSLRIEE